MICESSNKFVGKVELPHREQSFFWDGQSQVALAVESDGEKQVYGIEINRLKEYIEYSSTKDRISVETVGEQYEKLKQFLSEEPPDC